MRMEVVISGRVQGVGFRWWARCRARELGLDGTAANLPDGTVLIVAEGPEPACRRMLGRLEEDAALTARPGTVTGVRATFGPEQGVRPGFFESGPSLR